MHVYDVDTYKHKQTNKIINIFKFFWKILKIVDIYVLEIESYNALNSVIITEIKYF